MCTKAKEKFKTKMSWLFAALDSINKESEKLEKLGVISKVNY